jgi:Hypothetical protein (DUF2513)
MKRDMDTIRDLLLRIEAADYLPAGEPVMVTLRFDAFVQPGEDPNKLAYHMRLLIDEGLVKPTSIRGPEFFGILGLTSRGHDFLDSVRDPAIWRKTRAAAAGVGGSTVEILSALAKGFIKQQAKKYTGLEIDL